MTGSVSVLIDTYNHERYIETAIRSVLQQEDLDNTAIEIIVVDDGSTDGTREVVQKFGKFLKYFYKPNGGQASAFNFGIPLCEGEIICFLDGDDWWHPKKIRTVLDAFSADTERVGVGHSFIEVDEISQNSLSVGPQSILSLNFVSKASIELFHRFACCLGTSRLAMRRSVAFALLTIPERLVFEADEYMFTLLPTLGKVAILPDALTFYRIHGNNLYQGSRNLPLRYKVDEKLIKRALIYECLSKELPVELRKRGCDGPLLNLLLEPVVVQASRLKLMTVGGTPVENYRSERRAAALDERSSTLRKVVLLVSLGLALILPPRVYFRLRQRYTNLLRRIRRDSMFSNSDS
jgi:glycosyltransferase involved in cell wall biosynthesis